jgi:hypothetical protein
MGELSPPRGRQGNLCSERRQGLVIAMAMGDKKASNEGRQMGYSEILSNPRRPAVGICSHRKTRRWDEERGHLASRMRHANTAACQDPIRRQSARPEMGTVLRNPMGSENAELGERSNEALPRLVEARRHLPCLSGTNHTGQSLDCPAYRETD